MGKYKIEVKLCTESIFGSGFSIPGAVDLEIVHDEIGLPYMKAKTFKGNLREQISDVVKLLKRSYNLDFKEAEESLLGKEDNGVCKWVNLRFSDCRLSENIRRLFQYAIDNKQITPAEVIEALTEVRSFTSINEDGGNIEGSLRQYRVIKKGLTFYVDVDCERELTENELSLLSLGICSMRHIGTMRSRGKGEIEAKLLESDNKAYIDKTHHYIEKLMEEVAQNV